MKTLDEIKDEVARESKFINSWELIDKADWHTINDAVDEVCKRYAKECCIATLEKASQSMEMGRGINGDNITRILKELITNPDNIVL